MMNADVKQSSGSRDSSAITNGDWKRTVRENGAAVCPLGRTVGSCALFVAQAETVTSAFSATRSAAAAASRDRGECLEKVTHNGKTRGPHSNQCLASALQSRIPPTRHEVIPRPSLPGWVADRRARYSTPLRLQDRQTRFATFLNVKDVGEFGHREDLKHARLQAAQHELTAP